MDPANFDRLPPRAQQLVREIEERLGNEIQVDLHQPVDGPSLCGEAELELVSHRGRATARILHVAPECAVNVLAHEVLHAHRYVVLGIPYLQSNRYEWNLGSAGWASAIEEAVEHLFVIPSEIEMFPESAATWQGKFDRAWIDAAQRPLDQGERELVLQWMVADLTVPGWPGKELFAERLEQLGCGERARNLVAQFKGLGSDKMGLLLAVVLTLGLPQSAFRVTFDSWGPTSIGSMPASAR